MSQIQQPGVVADVLCIRGIDIRSKSLIPSNSQYASKQMEENSLRDLVHVWHKIKDRRSLDFSWRDKFEYQLIRLDHIRGQAILCQDQQPVLRRIERANGRMWLWRPGPRNFTIEATAAIPYSPQLEDLLGLEQSFTRRRKYLRSLLNQDQAPFTLNILPDLDGPGPEVPHVKVAKHDRRKSEAVQFRMPEYKIPESETIQFKTPEYKVPESEVIQFRTPEYKIAESEIMQFQAPEHKVPEPDTNQFDTLEHESPESQVVEVRTPESESPSPETVRFNIPEYEAPEAKVIQFKMPESESTTDEASTHEGPGGEISEDEATKEIPEEMPRTGRARQRKASYVIPQRRMSTHVRSHSMEATPQDVQSEPSSPTSKFSRMSRPRLRSVVTDNAISHLKPQTESPVFELGSRGLEVTFGCHDLREARYLHDQLCVLSPIMMAFTASTPVHRGHLSDYDVRMKSVSSSAADYKPGESSFLRRPWRQLYPTYLSMDSPKCRITKSSTNKDVFQRLRQEGFDDVLAAYCAQGYSCAFPQAVKKDTDPKVPVDVAGARLFQKFTASLNPHVQLELPSPHDLRTGFRVKFGAMEIQLTDFSNAACIFFIGLLRFAILGFDLDFRLPPHMVAENVAKAHKVDGILTEQFWWRSVRWTGNGLGLNSSDQPLTTDAQASLVSIDHIINGDPSRPETVGLSGVLDAYLADLEDSNDGVGYGDEAPHAISSDNDMAVISRYLAFIRRRAKGTVRTDARLIREFISNHPNYQDEEVLDATVWYDLVRSVEDLNDGVLGIRL